jgi:hypothetical protein
MLPVSQPMTTLQNIQLGIALAATPKQEIAAPTGGSARAYLAQLSRHQRSYPQSFNGKMACLARIFMQVRLCRRTLAHAAEGMPWRRRGSRGGDSMSMVVLAPLTR